MTTHRLFPPASGNIPVFIVNGRSYQPSAGAAQDVPDFDSEELQANGWVFVAVSGPTTARPVGTLGAYAAVPGFRFYDTTISEMVVYDGQNWRNLSGTVS